MSYYVVGEWHTARDYFVKTWRLSDGKDGPTKFMIKYIGAHGGRAPESWCGFRFEE
jgi:hypothetical protein